MKNLTRFLKMKKHLPHFSSYLLFKFPHSLYFAKCCTNDKRDKWNINYQVKQNNNNNNNNKNNNNDNNLTIKQQKKIVPGVLTTCTRNIIFCFKYFFLISASNSKSASKTNASRCTRFWRKCITAYKFLTHVYHAALGANVFLSDNIK